MKIMLSYQHGYHAGNFADVVKHLVLTRILDYLVQKDKPLFYLETHAGRGLYSLSNAQAQKTREYTEGIELLWKQDQLFSNPIMKPYLDLLISLNPKGMLSQYPGSPYIAKQLLRPIDRLFLCELHPQEFKALQQLQDKSKSINIKQEDGFEQLQALLPPKEKRGLIFIDPSYEVKSDYKTVAEKLAIALKRFAQGVYCIWYPILDKKYHLLMKEKLSALPAEKVLIAEFSLSRKPTTGMYGCGLWIINPPYTLAQELESGFNELKKIMNPGDSYYSISN